MTFSIQHLTWADFAIVGIVGISALISLMRGFVREAISLATWVIAAWIAIRFSSAFTQLLVPYIHSNSMRSIAAFAILFITALILGALINHAVAQLIDMTGLSGTDRLLGLLFGVARGVLLIGVLVLLGNMGDLSKNTWWANSQLIPHFQGIATWLKGFVPEQMNSITKDWITPPS